jgi:hypothetical protein
MTAARLIARAVRRVAPAASAAWADAMAMEILHVEGAAGWRFAAGCLAAALRMRLETMGRDTMASLRDMIERPRAMALACGVAATLAGLVYLATTGAPATMLAANAGALLLGLLVVAIGRSFVAPASLVVVAGGAMFATALLGVAPEGAARWVRIAGLSLQPSLILLPAAIVLHLLRRDAATSAGIVAIAAGLALQPDRAMAAVLLAALLAGGRRSGAVPTVAAALAFAVTLLRPDTLPAVPWVDGVLASAVAAGFVPGTAAILGTLVLLLPALAGLRDGRPAPRAFGACWIAIVAAAALGNYPMPLVGFGGSAILGYLLAAGTLPRRGAAHRQGEIAAPTNDGGSAKPLLRTA